MRRNVAMVSAAVTTFTLVVLISVVYAYSGTAASASSLVPASNPAVKTIQVQDPQSVQPTAGSTTPGLAAPAISAQSAASIAAQFVHRTDLFSAEMSTYNGAPAFKILFSNGEAVFVSLGGQVLGVVPAATYVPSAPSGGGGGGRGSNSSSHGGSDDSGSEHETESGGGGSGD